MGRKITVANLVMLGGAAATLLGSFLDFYDFGDLGGASAWDTDYGAFVTTIAPLLALVMLAFGIAELVGVTLPDTVLTFDHAQLKATWGIAATGVMLAFLTTDGDKGIGFWLILLGSLAMAAGAVMALLGRGRDHVHLGGSSGAATTAARPSAPAPAPAPGMFTPLAPSSPPPPPALPPPPPPPTSPLPPSA